MKRHPMTQQMVRGLGGAGFALGLAFSGGAALAGQASLTVTNFSVAATAADPAAFVLFSDAYQSWNMLALNGGGLFGSVGLMSNAPSWSPVAKIAQTSQATARGNTETFTDNTTQQINVGFTLLSFAAPDLFPAGTPANSAYASMFQSGTINLYDSNGNPTAGTVTLTIDYNLSVSSPQPPKPAAYSQAFISLKATDDGGTVVSSGGLLSSDFAGGVSSNSGEFKTTFVLGTGVGSYALLGTTYVAEVPESGTGPLLLIGSLMTMLAAARRRFMAGSVPA